MKKLKFIVAVVLAIVCMNFAGAVNPSKESNEKLANILVEKLNADVQLTDSQKIVLKVKVKEFITSMESVDAKGTPQEKITAKQIIADTYEASVDSILSVDQKARLKEKITQRKNAK